MEEPETRRSAWASNVSETLTFFVGFSKDLLPLDISLAG